MWNNLLSSATDALEKTTASLEKAGDVLTEKATKSARTHSERLAAERSSASASATPATPKLGPGPGGVDLDQDDREQVRLAAQKVLDVADSSPTAAAATFSSPNAAAAALQAQQSLSRLGESFRGLGLGAGATTTAAAAGTGKTDPDAAEAKKKEMLSNLSKGWGSVVEATKKAADAAKETIEKEQTRLQATFAKGPYRRDPKLPLDVDALRDAEVVYITDRLITMGHPAMQSSTMGDVTAERKLAAVGHLLDRRHAGRYMVYNLSEVEYDYSVLDEQVLTYKFPGSPAPPLGLMLKLLMSIESWLKSDPENVAVLHCLTGRGRTSTVLAAFLCWTGEAGFHDPNSALEYIAKCKRLEVETLTIPSQRRYTSYFTNMLDGVRPSQPPLLLKRIIMSEAPKFGKRPPPAEGEPIPDKPDELGCSPYLQIFKAGNLVFTTAATMSYSQSDNDLPFCCPSDGPISFNVETVVQGDILIRCRHLTRKGQRISMFRAAFHTGYIPPKVMRLTKTQLDGACSDRRYADDFFLDLIFEACDAEMASKHLLKESKEDEEEAVEVMKEETAHNEASARRSMGTEKGATAISATAYDTMLHRDSRFWEVIGNRRRENTKKIASAEAVEDDDLEKRYCGPTIGRRRDLQTGKTSANDGGGPKDEQKTTAVSQEEKKAIEAFSIGGEFDFLGDDDDAGAATIGAAPAHHHSVMEEDPPTPAPPKKDDLMDALMALDEDDDIDAHSPMKSQAEDVEEVIFDHGGDTRKTERQPEPELQAVPAESAPVEPLPDLFADKAQFGVETTAAIPEPVAVAVDNTSPALDPAPLTPVAPPVPAESIEMPGPAVASTIAPEPEPGAITPVEETVLPVDTLAADAVAPETLQAAKSDTATTDAGLAELGVDLGEMDVELEAAIAAAGDGNAAADTDFDLDDFDFDDDDDELEDLEAFLSKNT